jgi:putative nucleotidyltransferase with HDIG domain
MHTELQQLAPEFDLIKDEKLKQKVLACWCDALSQGGWQIADLTEIPFTLLIENCTVSFLEHVRAVTQTALATAHVLGHFYPQIALDMDIIVAGGLLHDIGKLLEYKKEENRYLKSSSGKLLRHPFSGAALAGKHNLPDEIVHIIATHAKEGDLGYRSAEAIIVHHADFMNFEPLKNHK